MAGKDLQQQVVPRINRSRKAPVQAVNVEALVLTVAVAVAVLVGVPVRSAHHHLGHVHQSQPHAVPPRRSKPAIYGAG